MDKLDMIYDEVCYVRNQVDAIKADGCVVGIKNAGVIADHEKRLTHVEKIIGKAILIAIAASGGATGGIKLVEWLMGG
jgi:hypothetical protein